MNMMMIIMTSIGSNSSSSSSTGRRTRTGRHTVNDSDAGGGDDNDDETRDGTWTTITSIIGGIGTGSNSYSSGGRDGDMTALADEAAVTTTMTLDAKAAT